MLDVLGIADGWNPHLQAVDAAAAAAGGLHHSTHETFFSPEHDLQIADRHETTHPVLSASDFEANGTVDPIHDCEVHGNVIEDMNHIHQQTHGSCSLMAQEQFVERYLGVQISEADLEKLAASWGVYSPESGTTFAGLDAVLDYFDVPHQRVTQSDLEHLDATTQRGNDVVVSVDSREFYGDVTIPPDSGHAVAIIGKGVDPATGATTGYYFSDSNFPNSARYLTIPEVENAWYRDMIIIPSSVAAGNSSTT